jgi:hypothetical protein
MAPQRIRQLTITSHAILITRKPQTGSSKGAFSGNGNQKVLLSGLTENVRYPPSAPTLVIVAGSGKSILWFVDLQLHPSWITDVSCQFYDHRRR